MFQKWIMRSCCLLPFMVLSAEITSQNNELSTIENDIRSLKEQLNRINLKMMDEEVEGQGYMIADWNAYQNELELIRRQQEEEKKIDKQIKILEERKKQILDLQHQSH